MSDKSSPPGETTVYQIINWDACFENNKSRERDECSWCALPNKQDGLGYGMLLRMPNGPALYGAFVAVVLVASKQNRPRDGHLTDTGRADGRPHTAETLSIKTRMPENLIADMLAACTSENIGWIKTYKSALRVPTECPPTAPSGKGREGKEEKEEKVVKTAVELDRYQPLKHGAGFADIISHLQKSHAEFGRTPEGAIIASLNICRADRNLNEIIDGINDMIRHYAGDAPLGMPATRRLETYILGPMKDRKKGKASAYVSKIPFGKPGEYTEDMLK